jgi:lysophospholipase L1-like esterase
MRMKLFNGIVAAAALGLGLALTARAADTNKAHHLQWEPAIRTFEAMDKTNPPPKDAVLLIGSSSIRKWTNAPAAFPKYRIINRGFGGSHLSDSVAFVDRIVVPYKPRVVALYAGDNDLAAKKTPEQVWMDFKAFVKAVHAKLPETHIMFISIKPSPSREKLMGDVSSANTLIRDFIGEGGNLSYVDVYTPMLTGEGHLRPELYVKDRLHLNEEGYKVWANVLRPALDGLNAAPSGGLKY